MATLDEIRKAIADKVGINMHNPYGSDYVILSSFLYEYKKTLTKNEYDKLKALMLNFTLSSNILALQLIYKKYVK